MAGQHDVRQRVHVRAAVREVQETALLTPARPCRGHESRPCASLESIFTCSLSRPFAGQAHFVRSAVSLLERAASNATADLAQEAKEARRALATAASDGLRAAAEPLLYAGCLDALSTGSGSSQCVHSMVHSKKVLKDAASDVQQQSQPCSLSSLLSCADLRSATPIVVISDALLQGLPEGLGLDVALLQPVLLSKSLLARHNTDAANMGAAVASASSSAAVELFATAAAAARHSGNVAFASRLLQQASAEDASGLEALRIRIAAGELSWAESPLATGRLEVLKQLAASLNAATAGPAEGSPTGGLRARGWMLLHSWLSELEPASQQLGDVLSMSSPTPATSGEDLVAGGHRKQLALLDTMELTPGQRASAVCLRAAIAAHEDSSEAWRALGVWLSDCMAASSLGAADAGDAQANGAADRDSWDARGLALLAYCQSLRAAGLSKV